MNSKSISLTGIFLSCFLIFSSAQISLTDWHLGDPGTTGLNGIGLNKLKEELSGTNPRRSVVVAILDTGVDIDHEDLRDNIWVNRDEIPGNDVDDDGNGYVDDVHGWNFIGGPDGENVVEETLEVTRLYARYRDYFEDKDVEDLSRRDEKLYALYLETKQAVEKERKKAEKALDELQRNESMLMGALDKFETRFPGQELTEEFVESFEPGDDVQMQIAHHVLQNIMAYGVELTDMAALKKDITMGYAEEKKEYENKLNYRYNPDFKSRKIIGDDYSNQTEKYYGNNDYESRYAFHGTVVAGIVGAVSDNGIGINGIADAAELMVVRMLPDGDEHDKDVANAIRYAVDNGASVINMSFGKGYSWNKKVVDDAVRYAAKNDVLLVHASGNDSGNNDIGDRFPAAQYEKRCFLFGKKEAANWLEVGALFWEPGENAIASFSNYGKETVDLFAPGVQIYSTSPGDAYQAASGTSMAAPVVAGAAALIRSYYPTLTAEQVKEVLVKSSTPFEGKVVKPGTSEKVQPEELSGSGGALNIYEAFKLAAGTKGKKKLPDLKSSKA